MDILVKISLIAAVAFTGYSLSDALASYKVLCQKSEEFKSLAEKSGASENNLRMSNLLLSVGLFIGLLLLLYFSHVAFWILVTLFIKFAVTLFFSDISLLELLRIGFVSKKMYTLSKFDSFLNVLFGIGIALVLVL